MSEIHNWGEQSDEGEIFTHHGTVRNETDEGKRRDQAQADDQRVAKSFQILFVETSIYDEQEDWWSLCGTRERVFNCGVLGQELRGEVRV